MDTLGLSAKKVCTHQWHDTWRNIVQTHRQQPSAPTLVVEPSTARNQSAPTHADSTTSPTHPSDNDADTVEKVDEKLRLLEQYWGRMLIWGPFPECLRSAMADLRAALEKKEARGAGIDRAGGEGEQE
jgi:hypothetical protein